MVALLVRGRRVARSKNHKRARVWESKDTEKARDAQEDWGTS